MIKRFFRALWGLFNLRRLLGVFQHLLGIHFFHDWSCWEDVGEQSISRPGADGKKAVIRQLLVQRRRCNDCRIVEHRHSCVSDVDWQ